ncbi:PAAR domain-containing protein [Burkholderia gladioli]|nr:hypothetical protein CEJ98_33925 [Burkholderia gladioli pv. gladioli]MBU9188068.1 PAAR domain-containing protein [Burkholderia gladioli]AWY51250.1 hypothetical protein A8H28_08690 [Burkholderia gladioli pv. gladioli]MBU9275222.1 PAAR domain-containing protein [Burkholderia gladioli]MBU9320958.1 PAAR domain-containing protein [Burkholderia gladioli]
MINLIRVGNDTDHDDKVETGSATMRYDGRQVARQGDLVCCPRHPDVSPNVVEEGDTSLTDTGVPIVRHGHHATCRCRLLSTPSLPPAIQRTCLAAPPRTASPRRPATRPPTMARYA